MVKLQLDPNSEAQFIQAVKDAKNALTPKKNVASMKQHFIGLAPNGNIGCYPNNSALNSFNALPLVEFTVSKGVITPKAISALADERMMATVRATPRGY